MIEYAKNSPGGFMVGITCDPNGSITAFASILVSDDEFLIERCDRWEDIPRAHQELCKKMMGGSGYTIISAIVVHSPVNSQEYAFEGGDISDFPDSLKVGDLVQLKQGIHGYPSR